MASAFEKWCVTEDVPIFQHPESGEYMGITSLRKQTWDAALEEAAKIAGSPYSDEVAVIHGMEPREIGTRIAFAIRALKGQK